MEIKVPAWTPEAWEIEQLEIIRGVIERESREIAEIPVGPFEPVRGWVPTIREQAERPILAGRRRAALAPAIGSAESGNGMRQVRRLESRHLLFGQPHAEPPRPLEVLHSRRAHDGGGRDVPPE